MLYYHLQSGITALSAWFDTNISRDEILSHHLCPFLLGETVLSEGRILNMKSIGHMRIFETARPVDSAWPVNKQEYSNAKGSIGEFAYDQAFEEALERESRDATQELYREAIVLIERGEYKELRAQIAEAEKGRYSFFVCPFENEEVDHNYEFVIKPVVRQFQFDIQRVDEISHTGTITEEILEAVRKSRFVVADLTDERPNCYYEVGYAHALGKPVNIMAKRGTKRHFDISTYKWSFWDDYSDLKPTFEKGLLAVLRDLGLEAQL